MKEYKERAGLSPVQLTYGALGLVGGVWMILAPFVLNYDAITVLNTTTKKQVSAELGPVTTNDIICGVLLIALVGFALLTANNAAMSKFRLYAGIATIGVGLYLMAAPYLFDLLKVAEYLSINKPNTNDVLIGLLTVIIAGFAVQHEFVPAQPKTTTNVSSAV
ncbi:MAG TPA: hypothetical protein VH186_30955 [Chloroflexia bacterium]|nr:hypothetical protein [Chloroflexia bacterium]